VQSDCWRPSRRPRRHVLRRRGDFRTECYVSARRYVPVFILGMWRPCQVPPELPFKMPTVEIICNPRGFHALRDEWNALPQASQMPLARHEWFEASARAFGHLEELQIFVARIAGVARSIVPLRIDRSGYSPRLRMLDSEIEEPKVFLHNDEGALSAACGALLASPLPVQLSRIGVDSAAVGLLQASPREGGWLAVRPPWMQTARVLTSDWRDIESGMSASGRRSMRRRLKIAEKEGAVVFEVVSPDETNVAACLDEVFRIEVASWKGRNGTALLTDHDQRFLRFYKEFGSVAAKLGILRLFFLRIGGATAAAQMTLEFAHRLWVLKIGYDERFAKCAPGILLTHEMLRYAFEQGLVALEFLGQAEQWQKNWPLVLDPYTTVRFYPRSIRGALALGYDAYQFGARRVMRSKFPRVASIDPEQ
jgi:CelD/BcsL family acetyltransferase involved in cellulose biosynthesis